MSFARPADALQLLARYGIGITLSNLTLVPIHTTSIRAVPFFSQAPLGDWYDPRQSEGRDIITAML